MSPIQRKAGVVVVALVAIIGAVYYFDLFGPNIPEFESISLSDPRLHLESPQGQVADQLRLSTDGRYRAGLACTVSGTSDLKLFTRLVVVNHLFRIELTEAQHDRLIWRAGPSEVQYRGRQIQFSVPMLLSRQVPPGSYKLTASYYGKPLTSTVITIEP